MKYIEFGKEDGADLVYGGAILNKGEFKKDIILSLQFSPMYIRISRIAKEEIFGPVVAIIEVDSYEEAIDVANDVEYGLSASIVTNNLKSCQPIYKGYPGWDGKG